MSVLQRLLRRDRALYVVAFTGLSIFALLLDHLMVPRQPLVDARMLTDAPWYCEVADPDGLPLVARSIATFHAGGASEGRTRLEDLASGRLLLEFSYQGLWRIERASLVEAVSGYRYLHVDPSVFSDEALAAIEAEFAEPEISSVYRITPGELIYGVDGFVYECRRPARVG